LRLGLDGRRLLAFLCPTNERRIDISRDWQVELQGWRSRRSSSSRGARTHRRRSTDDPWTVCWLHGEVADAVADLLWIFTRSSPIAEIANGL